MSFVVKSKIKEAALADGKQQNVSGDFSEALDKKVQKLIRDASERAAANGRSTVMAKDL